MTPHQSIRERLRNLIGVSLPAFALDNRIEYQLLKDNGYGHWSGPRVAPTQVWSDWIQPDSIDEYTLIGTTGWCPDAGIALALSCDIDGSNHDNNSVDAETINRYTKKLSKIDCIRVNRSKSGRGLQVWAYGEWPAPTRKHLAALGAAFAAWLSQSIGEQIVIDVKGGNMWIWSDDKSRDGFNVISEATTPFTATLNPAPVAKPSTTSAPSILTRSNNESLIGSPKITSARLLC